MSVLSGHKILEVCLELSYDFFIVATAEPPLVLFGTCGSIQTAIIGRSEPEKQNFSNPLFVSSRKFGRKSGALRCGTCLTAHFQFFLLIV